MTEKNRRKRRKLTRREFLIATGIAGGGIALGLRFGIPAMRLSSARSLEGSAGAPETFDAPPDAWFEIRPDNSITLRVPKVEMGQGIFTAFAQIAAEELEVDWERIDVVPLPTNQAAEGQQGSGFTGSSNSVANLFQPLREAAAAMRAMIMERAAGSWGVPPGAVGTEDGEVFLINEPTKRLAYGQTVAGVEEWALPTVLPTLKPVSEFRAIGRSWPRVDLPEKITGQAVYGYDARIPGMRYGAVARPPAFGSELRRASAGNAGSMPGVLKIVIEDGFAGVVAESRVQAWAALGALDLQWSDGPALQQADIEEMVTVGKGSGTVIQKEGEDIDAFFDGGSVIEASYRTPLAAHAHLEPQAALADVQADTVEIWTSTQAPWIARDRVAEVLGREPEEVIVYPTMLGGGFGRRISPEAAVEAARLSAAAGEPVHVGWKREDEFQNGFLRPPTQSTLRATLNARGFISAIEHQQASGDVAFPFVPGFLSFIMGADFGATRGASIRYGIPNRRTIAWRTEIPVPTGWWRGLGLLPNIFAIESFMDELAHAASADPIEFRLRHLPTGEAGRRYRRLIETLAGRAGWTDNRPAGRALGFAMADDVGTLVAQVAEVSIENGKIRVHRVTAAMDCGLVINPDGAEAQVQGSIMMGLSSTLKEQITIKDGRVTAENFGGYPLLAMDEAPEIDVILLESGDTPSGVGEPPIGPTAAAVANAVYALTGERLRSLPLRL